MYNNPIYDHVGSYGLPGLFSGIEPATGTGSAISGSFSQCDTGTSTVDCIRSFTDTSSVCGQRNSVGIICKKPTNGRYTCLITYRFTNLLFYNYCVLFLSISKKMLLMDVKLEMFV